MLEAVIPRFLNGKIDLEKRWLDERGVPVIEDVIFSSSEPDTVLEGLDELEDSEMEWIHSSGDFCPLEDCWQEVIGSLENLIPDEPLSDHPLSCDYCHQDLTFDEPALRVRHYAIVTNPRDKQQPRFEETGGYSDFIMCLSCAFTMAKEVIPQDECGRRLWPTL